MESPRIRFVITITLLYGGGICLALPVLTYDMPRVFQALLQPLGIILLMSGVMLLFLLPILNRIDRLTDFSQASRRTGIVDIVVLGPGSFDALRDRLLPSYRLHIVINPNQAARQVTAFLQYLARSVPHVSPRMIVGAPVPSDSATPTPDGIVKLPRDLTELLSSLRDPQATKWEVRVSETPFFQTLVMSDSYAAAMLPHEPSGDDSLVVVVDHRSALRRYYEREFDVQWGTSKPLDALARE